MPKKKRAVPEPQRERKSEYVLPDREWDRATDLIKLFVATGWLENIRSQSVMLNAEPGSGKTELLERFRINNYMRFPSDLTARGVHSVLRDAQKGAVTHIVATEFQKYLMRKASTAENMLGVLTQAIEEGVRETLIGERIEDFGGARFGFIGAITDETLSKRRQMLKEVGFTSRVCIFKWSMPQDEILAVMRAIGRDNRDDLMYVHMHRPQKLIHVDMQPKYSDLLLDYVHKAFRQHSELRVFQRFRALCMASAVLDGRKSVTGYDVSRVFAFHPYWEIMEKG